MKASALIAQLDNVRSRLRSLHGNSDASVPPDGEIAKSLETLSNSIKNTTVRKRTIEVLEDEDGHVILPENQQVVIADHSRAALQQEGTQHVAPHDPNKPMTVTPLPRDPKPVHPVDVEPATESTVADPGLLSTVTE